MCTCVLGIRNGTYACCPTHVHTNPPLHKCAIPKSNLYTHKIYAPIPTLEGAEPGKEEALLELLRQALQVSAQRGGEDHHGGDLLWLRSGGWVCVWGGGGLIFVSVGVGKVVDGCGWLRFVGSFVIRPQYKQKKRDGNDTSIDAHDSI